MPFNAGIAVANGIGSLVGAQDEGDNYLSVPSTAGMFANNSEQRRAENLMIGGIASDLLVSAIPFDKLGKGLTLTRGARALDAGEDLLGGIRAIDAGEDVFGASSLVRGMRSLETGEDVLSGASSLRTAGGALDEANAFASPGLKGAIQSPIGANAGVTTKTLGELGEGVIDNSLTLKPLGTGRAGTSELGNALSGLGRNPLGRNINALEEFGSGAGFSGVFDVDSQKFLAYPSGETTLLSGKTPLNLVKQFGGHQDVNDALTKLLGKSSDNRLGFSMKLDDAGNFSLGWNSRTINEPNPNFPGRNVPVEMRQQVLDAIMQHTGKKVN